MKVVAGDASQFSELRIFCPVISQKEISAI